MNKPVYDVQPQVQAAFMDHTDIQDYDITTLRSNISNQAARGVDGVVSVIIELDLV